jgi:hypothetical protein
MGIMAAGMHVTVVSGLKCQPGFFFNGTKKVTGRKSGLDK